MERKIEPFMICIMVSIIMYILLFALDIYFSCKLYTKKKTLLKAETNVSELYADFCKARERVYAVSILGILAGTVMVTGAFVDDGLDVFDVVISFCISAFATLLLGGPRTSVTHSLEKLDKQQKRIDALIAVEQKKKSIETEDAAQQEETHS